LRNVTRRSTDIEEDDDDDDDVEEEEVIDADLGEKNDGRAIVAASSKQESIGVISCSI
jgi:hypothetical protein